MTLNRLVHVLLPMRPTLVEKVWGGERLHARGKVWSGASVDVAHVGEAWEVADLPGGQSVVSDGPAAGIALGDLVKKFGADLVGSNAPTTDAFPLLVKLIDASADLSVQVHPNAQQASEREGAAPKDECWLVLEVAPGAKLAHGFVDDSVTEERFRNALEQKTPEELLRFVDVKPGDILRVSPGTVHAIGSGVFLLEVQEPSDTTYRVWDYERRGLDGELRDLHLEDALDVLRYGAQPPALVEPTPATDNTPRGICADLLVDAPRYRLELLTLQPSANGTMKSSETTPLVLTVLEGTLTLKTAEQQCTLSALQSLVIPATCGRVDLVVDGDSLAKVTVAGLGPELLSVFVATTTDAQGNS